MLIGGSSFLDQEDKCLEEEIPHWLGKQRAYPSTGQDILKSKNR